MVWLESITKLMILPELHHKPPVPQIQCQRGIRLQRWLNYCHWIIATGTCSPGPGPGSARYPPAYQDSLCQQKKNTIFIRWEYISVTFGPKKTFPISPKLEDFFYLVHHFGVWGEHYPGLQWVLCQRSCQSFPVFSGPSSSSKAAVFAGDDAGVAEDQHWSENILW